MEFGRLTNIDHIDFTLPPDHSGINRVLGGKRKPDPRVYVGAPVWSHPGFPGKIYPPQAHNRDFIRYYGQQFNCIELNTTHYRIPAEHTIQHWADSVPDDFRFCPKIPQSISHSRNINRCTEELHLFSKRIAIFGDKLGTTFLQLPPAFGVHYLPLLTDFLKNCPIRDLAIELRHESWFSNEKSLKELSNFLYKQEFAFNITDVAGRRDVLHQRLTNPTAFIRFVANNLHPTDFDRMNDWLARIIHWIESGIEQVYFLMHTPDKSLTPELCIYFINRLNQLTGLRLKPPHIIIHETGLFSSDQYPENDI